MRVALVMSCSLVLACAQPPATPRNGEPSTGVNQFRARADALTLADGGLCPITVSPDAELMIRSVAVVEDPLRTNWSGGLANPSDGAWTFGRLMTTMAGVNDPEQFVRAWAAQWDAPQTINGLPVAPRPMNNRVIAPWPTVAGRLDLTRAPMRLLAIVNRMDLRDLSRGSAGEGRFVFGVLGAGGAQLQFTVILEFNLPAATEADVERWAADWHALGSLPLGSPAYNQALEAITNRFAGPNAAPGRPNNSAINQVRSNEIALAAPWELREFRLNGAGQLAEVPVAQTTDLPLNDTPTLAQFINANTPALLTDTHVVPATFNGAPFLAGSALTNLGHVWRAPGITNNEARFHFSVNTCNGCHAGETNTIFLHVFPRNPGQASALSGFLTGTTVPDPVTGQPRTFNDLAVRSESLLAVLCRAPGTTRSVAITSPTAGSTVRGPTTLKASASGVDTVQFFVDGVPVSPALPPPFEAPWSGDFVAPGQHTATAVGQSATGSVTSLPVTFTTAPAFAPDFTVTITSAPALVAPGQLMTARLNVCNIGNVGGSTSVELFVSTDATISGPRSATPDFFVVGAPVTLASGACQAVSLSGPAFAPPSSSFSFFIGAIVDSFESVPERDETNNGSPAQGLIIGNGPDFIVTAAAPPASVVPGAPFTTQVTVCNQGNQPGFTDVELIASTDTVIQAPPDFLVGTLAQLSLGAGQCVTSPVQAFGLPTGTFFVAAAAVRSGFELVATNNTSPASRLNVGFQAELTVRSVSAPFSALPGATFTTSAVICNDGTITATTTGLLVLAGARSFGLPPAPDVVPVSPFSVTIAAGSCVTRSLSGPANAPPGVLAPFVGVVLDEFNSVPEFDETNNQLASLTGMGVGFMPDFTVSSVSAPAALLPGAPFTAAVVVCNRGTAPGATNVELRLTDGSNVVPLGGVFVSLNASQCLSQTINAAASPPPTPGPLYSLVAVADVHQQVAEFSETNNESPAFSMAIGLGPDFVVTRVTLPSAVAPFDPFTATISVCNRGTAPGAAQVDLIASSDRVVTLTSGARLPGAFFSLAANQCQTQTVQSVMAVMPPPPPALATTFFVAGVADPDGQLTELRETNNVGPATSFLLGRAPDFVVTSFTAPTSAAFGGTFSSSVTVCNRGTSPGAANLSFVIATAAGIPSTLPLPSTAMPVPAQGDSFFSLAPNACQSRTFLVTALTPGGVRGSLRAGAIIDLSQSVQELRETNNVSPVRALTVL